MPLLEVADLKKSYRSPDGVERLVIDVPRFVLEPREQVALAGSSGSGKTTLLNLLAGIQRPDSGRIELGGSDLTALTEGQRDVFRAHHIGYVFQTFHLLQGYTALENVILGMMFGKGIDRGTAAGLLTELGLADRMQYRPGQLSSGQQQRVALARALANRPELVLADEPTGNLDTRNAGEALALLRKACAEHGAALLLVSHDRHVLDEFERVVQLSEINRCADGADHSDSAGEGSHRS